jgi:hypothetical protein
MKPAKNTFVTLTIFLISVVCMLGSCTTKNVTDRKILRITDLKFPLIDVDNNDDEDRYRVLPNPYKKNLLDNHVIARISKGIFDSTTDSGRYLKQYLQDPAHEKIDISTWYTDSISRRSPDTAFFDEKKNLTSIHRQCWMCSHKRYRYDSLGYRIWESSGSDVLQYYSNEFHFDPIARKLYCTSCYADRDTILPFQKSRPFGLKVYQFDTSAKLTSIVAMHIMESGILLAKFYFTRDTFLYNEENQISLTTNSFYVGNTLDITHWLDFPIFSVSKYFYHNRYLDSIITETTTTGNKKKIRRTYFDNSGLPVKTTLQGYYFPFREIRHSYIKF